MILVMLGLLALLATLTQAKRKVGGTDIFKTIKPRCMAAIPACGFGRPEPQRRYTESQYSSALSDDLPVGKKLKDVKSILRRLKQERCAANPEHISCQPLPIRGGPVLPPPRQIF